MLYLFHESSSNIFNLKFLKTVHKIRNSSLFKTVHKIRNSSFFKTVQKIRNSSSFSLRIAKKKENNLKISFLLKNE